MVDQQSTPESCSCGQAVVRMLQQRGVDCVFGIPGVHTLELYRGLTESSIRHVTPRHEQGAAFMADAYSTISGKPGVCFLITGPGLTNAATAIANAYHDSHPLLIISSATASQDEGQGRGPLHDLPNQQQLMATITEFSETVTAPAELAAALDRAFAVLEGPRPRPVHIGIPVDVLSEQMDWVEIATATKAADAEADWRVPARGDAVRRAANVLREAERPLILLGGGAVGAGEAALKLSAVIGAPIATTINGKGAVPETHPASIGNTVTLQPVYEALADADAVIAAGTELSDNDFYYYGRLPDFKGDVIRIDVDAQQLDTGVVATVGLLGDAEQTLMALARELDDGIDREAAAATQAKSLLDRLEWWDGAETLFPVVDELSRALPDDAIVVADSTQLAYVSNARLPVCDSHRYLCPAGFGTLGPSLPMAIGARLAAPDRPVLCLIGDGGLLFTIQELATASRLGLPIAVLLWQNDGYGEIRDSMDRASVPHLGTDVSAHDYLKIAEGFGCRGVRVQSLDEIAPALDAAFSADRPTLLELGADLAR